MLKAAHWYAKRRLYVIPLHTAIDGACSCGNTACGSVGKHPRTAHGLDDATVDAETVSTFWTLWPDANIGIATGPSDLVVIDVDPKNGGDETFAVLRAQLGAEAFDTATVLTGGGGEHYYFRTGEKRFRNSAGKVLGDGIDVRADGGYVVAPPSIHASGKVYAWEAGYGLHERGAAKIPAVLEKRLAQRKDAQITGSEPLEIIPKGKRHETLVSFAGMLRRYGMEADEIEASLLLTNAKRCVPPCDPAHIRKMAQSVTKNYAPGLSLSGLVRAVLPEVKDEPVASEPELVPEQAGFAVIRSWMEPLEQRRYPTGIRDLDDVLQDLRPGELTLIGAWTGVGKSGLSEQIALEVSKTARTLFLPLELGVPRTERRMLAKIMQRSESIVERMERSELDSDKRALYEAVENLQSRRLTMLAPKPGEVYRYAQIKTLIKSHRPDVVFIDHLQHIDDWTPTANRSDLSAAKIFRDLRALADSEKVHIVCIHQLKAEKIAKSQRPQVYDFADSAALPRIADTVICLHRPFRGNVYRDRIMEILVLKNRRGPEPWIHTYFEGSHIAVYPMSREEAAFAECCNSRKGSK